VSNRKKDGELKKKKKKTGLKKNWRGRETVRWLERRSEREGDLLKNKYEEGEEQ
jgi:hypothetical protein